MSARSYSKYSTADGKAIDAILSDNSKIGQRFANATIVIDHINNLIGLAHLPMHLRGMKNSNAVP